MTKVTVDGLKDLERRLASLEMNKRANFARKVLRDAAAPVVSAANSGAPVGAIDNGGQPLKGSVLASNKLSPRQKRQSGRPERGVVEVYVGAAPANVVPHAHLQEFGTRHHDPQSFMRPAWDSNKMNVLERIRAGLAAALTRIGR